MINDHNIEWVRKRKYYTPFDMHCLTDPAALRVAGSTTIVPSVIPGTNAIGWVMTTGLNLDGWVPCPSNLDPSFPVGIRARWTADVIVTTVQVTQTILLNGIVNGGAIAAPSGVLDTLIGVQTYRDSAGAVSQTDALVQYSSRGIKNNIGLTRLQIEAGALLAMRFTPSVFVQITNFFLLGLEIDYVPIRCVGSGRELDCALSSTGF